MASILLVLSETFRPLGGIPAFNRLLCRACVEYGNSAGLQVGVLSLNDRPGAADWRYLLNADFWGASRNKPALVVRYLKWLACRRPEVVIAGHVNLAPLLLAACLPRSKCHTAVVVHGVEAWRDLSPVRRYGLRRADHVLAVSRFTGDMVMHRHGVAPDRVIWLPDALDPSWLLQAESFSVATQGAHQNDRLVLLTVGRMDASERYKGVDTVIEALPGLQAMTRQPVEYWVVGDGTDLPRLRALAAIRGVTEQVRFLGRVSPEELARCYAACDIFVMPSRGEGFGIVFLEAMAFGKPVVASTAGACPEVVIDGETGILVDYGDVAGLTAALSRLAAEPDLRRRLGEAGRQRLLAEFTYEHFAHRVGELLADWTSMPVSK